MPFIPRNLGREQLRSIQLAGLQWTVDHAYRNAPLYRNKFDAAGIKLYTGVTGTIAEAVERFKSDKLTSADGPSVESHFGMDK